MHSLHANYQARFMRCRQSVFSGASIGPPFRVLTYPPDNGFMTALLCCDKAHNSLSGTMSTICKCRLAYVLSLGLSGQCCMPAVLTMDTSWNVTVTPRSAFAVTNKEQHKHALGKFALKRPCDTAEVLSEGWASLSCHNGKGSEKLQ